jgi:transcriptional regulator with XRE-family HTH domain
MNSKSSRQDIYSVERAWLLFVFGENVRFLRKQRNLSQEAFAEAASLHRNAVGVIERGECEPGLLTLLILAETLGVPLERLREAVPAPKERRPRRR